jgi:hypothetical protein
MMARPGSSRVAGAAVLLLVALLFAPAGASSSSSSSSAPTQPPRTSRQLSVDKPAAAGQGQRLLPPSSQQQQQAPDGPTPGPLGLLDAQLGALGWTGWRSAGPASAPAPSKLPVAAATLRSPQLQQLTSQLRELMRLQQERCATRLGSCVLPRACCLWRLATRWLQHAAAAVAPAWPPPSLPTLRLQLSDTTAQCPAAAQLHHTLDAWHADAVAAAGSCSGLPDAVGLQRRLQRLEAAVAGLAGCSTMASLAPTRRYCVATLWRLHAGLAGCGQAALVGALRPAYARVLLMLQLQHQASLAARRLIEFTHISKTGGARQAAGAGFWRRALEPQ